MAKKRSAAKAEAPAQPTPDFQPPPTSELLQTLLENCERMTGRKGVYAAGVHGEFYWGIDLRHLPLQWVIGGLNILPYGHIIEVAGQPGSLKTSLSLELARLSIESGGIGIYHDAEAKTEGTVFPMIVGYDVVKRLIIIPGLKTIQEWQQSCNDCLSYMQRNDPEGRTPTLMIVDSLTARMSEEEIGNYEKSGSAPERSFPVGAMSITGFMKAFPSRLLREGSNCWPMSLICINHLKESMDPNSYQPRKYTPGGRGKEFHTSLRLWLSVRAREEYSHVTLNAHRPERLLKAGIELYGLGGMRTITIQCAKSSLGPDCRKVDVDYYWGWTRGAQQQYAWFDWDGALARMLSEDSGTHEIVRVERDRSYYTVKVNRVVELAAASSTEAGRWISQQPELMSRLYEYYHVVRRCVHVGGQSSLEAHESWQMCQPAAAGEEGDEPAVDMAGDIS